MTPQGIPVLVLYLSSCRASLLSDPLQLVDRLFLPCAGAVCGE